MKVAAVVPTRNEAETIYDLVRELDGFCDCVIVADDSSDTKTEAQASAAGALVCHSNGGGLAGAYADAWSLVPHDWTIAHIDAGGSHGPPDLVQMLDAAAHYEWDLVIGSRFVDDAIHLGPWWRRTASRLTGRYCATVTFTNVADWTSGLRVYGPRARAAVERHEFRTSGHAWQIESLWAIQRSGLRIEEWPIVYQPSTSSLSVGRSLEALRMMARLGWA